MRHSPVLVVLAVLAACSAPARPRSVAPPAPVASVSDAGHDPEPPPPLPPPDPGLAKLDLDWATISLASDADTTAVWRRIIPTAVDWELRVAQIPDDKLAPLIDTLLRGGNFACPPLPGGACTPGFLGWGDPPPDATFSDPCLRRTLALWALSVLDGDQVGAQIAVLRGLAASPQIDHELVDAVLVAARDQPEATRLELLRAAREAGHTLAVEDELGGLSEATLATAATELHIDAAVEALDVSLARPVYLAAARDQKLRPATRIAALLDLASLVERTVPRDLEKVLLAATRDPDCGVAAAAATTLAGFGKRDALPKRPRNRKVADAMRALCVMAAADAPQLAAGFVGPTGLKVIERTFDPALDFATDDDNSDLDNDPRTGRRVETIRRKDLVAIPFDTELPTAMERCAPRDRGITCTLPGVGIELTLWFIPARDGGLWLDAIERHDRGDCGPNDV